MKQAHKTASVAAREIYRYTHANMRLRDRYGIEIDLDEYSQICNAFRQKQYQHPRILTTGEVEAWVEVKGQWVCACYRPREGLVATFLPCPPGIQDILSQHKKQMEKEASRQAEAMKQELNPEAMRKEWLRRAALRTRMLLAENKQEELLDLFAEISRMRPNVSLRNHPRDWHHSTPSKTG